MSLSAPELAHYLCDMDEIHQRLRTIDPGAYDKTRNHLDGAVTWLSPFLSHGVIDTKTLADQVLANHSIDDCYRLMFELAWREYFHRVWQLHGDAIFSDMRQPQAGQAIASLPRAMVESRTGIRVIDDCLAHLQREGLMHNHARLWVAGITCNMAQTHWYEPARWFHYHLLDGDLASNTLSWQWVAGTFSHKVYVANQANINKYSSRSEQGTWLDVPYEAFDNLAIPQSLEDRVNWQSLENEATSPDALIPGVALQPFTGSVALYSLWNLDPIWQPDTDRRILFVDVDWHRQWPMSEKRWKLIRHWADQSGVEIRYGTVAALQQAAQGQSVVRKEYPACRHWPGRVEERRWLYPMPDKPFTSFTRFWKQVKGSVGL